MGSDDNLAKLLAEFKEEIKKRFLEQSYVSSKEGWYLEFAEKLKLYGISNEEIDNIVMRIYEEFLEKNIPQGLSNFI